MTLICLFCMFKLCGERGLVQLVSLIFNGPIGEITVSVSSFCILNKFSHEDSFLCRLEEIEQTTCWRGPELSSGKTGAGPAGEDHVDEDQHPPCYRLGVSLRPLPDGPYLPHAPISPLSHRRRKASHSASRARENRVIPRIFCQCVDR